MLKKITGAIRLYKFGIFRMYLNKLLPEYLQIQSFLLYRYELANSENTKAIHGIEFIKVEQADDPVFRKFQQKFPSKTFENRLQNGNQFCFIAMHKNEVAGYGWVAQQELY